MKETEKINIAPTSTEGHFIEKAKKVINLDTINETFYIEGGGILTTKNHTTLPIEEDCLITCQNVYNPLLKSFERTKD